MAKRQKEIRGTKNKKSNTEMHAALARAFVAFFLGLFFVALPFIVELAANRAGYAVFSLLMLVSIGIGIIGVFVGLMKFFTIGMNLLKKAQTDEFDEIGGTLPVVLLVLLLAVLSTIFIVYIEITFLISLF